MYIKRAFAYLIDISIASLLIMLAAEIFGKKNIDGGISTKGITGFAMIFTIVFCYYSFQEFYWHKTIGKKIFGLHIIKTNNTEISFWDISKRHLLDIFELMFLSPVGFLISLFNKKNQRVGDLLANTQVIPMAKN